MGHVDAFRPQLSSQGLGQAAERKFCTAESDSRSANRGGGTSKQDDTGALSKHLRNYRLATEKGAQHSNLPAVKEAFGSDLHEGLGKRSAGAGVVDQEIHRTEAVTDL